MTPTKEITADMVRFLGASPWDVWAEWIGRETTARVQVARPLAVLEKDEWASTIIASEFNGMRRIFANPHLTVKDKAESILSRILHAVMLRDRYKPIHRLNTNDIAKGIAMSYETAKGFDVPKDADQSNPVAVEEKVFPERLSFVAGDASVSNGRTAGKGEEQSVTVLDTIAAPIPSVESQVVNKILLEQVADKLSDEDLRFLLLLANGETKNGAWFKLRGQRNNTRGVQGMAKRIVKALASCGIDAEWLDAPAEKGPRESTIHRATASMDRSSRRLAHNR